MTKIKDLPDDYVPPITSIRFRDYKRVLIKDEHGVWFGWEAEDGTLHPGALVEPSDAHKQATEDFKRQVEKRRAEVRQRKVTINDLKRRRAAGEQMSQKDLNTLADLLLGRL